MFGIDPVLVVATINSYNLILKVLEEHQDYLNTLAANLQQMAQQTPSRGWPDTIQEAIMNLSQKIEYHREILQVHHNNLAELEIIQVSQVEDKKELN
jgi:ABC-type transporter Mla subunit MlaD